MLSRPLQLVSSLADTALVMQLSQREDKSSSSLVSKHWYRCASALSHVIGPSVGWLVGTMLGRSDAAVVDDNVGVGLSDGM